MRTSPAFVTINADGTRTWVHDPRVERDTLISTVRTDRGEGTSDSEKLLRTEGDVMAERLLAKPKEPSTPESHGFFRDGMGRFVRARSGA